MDNNTPGSDFRAQSEKKMAALEASMAPLFAKLPHLPADIIDFLVQIAPWLALIGGILGIAAVISGGLFVSLMSMTFLAMGISPLFMFLALLIMLLGSVLDLLAFQPLNARKKYGWNLLFYGTVLSAVSTIISLIFGSMALGSVIGLLIGFWLLFEVRGRYTA